MNQDQMQNDISIIKRMIDQTRRHTAESGSLFISIGMLWLFVPVLLVFLEKSSLKHYWWPVFIGGLVITLVIGLLIGIRESKKSLPLTYAKKVFSQLWIAVGSVCILTSVLFPLAGVYPEQYISIITWPVIAIGVYLSGVIYEITVIRWLSSSWLFGAILMAFITIPIHLYIAVFTLFFGFVLPGIVFSRNYKKRSI
ncbi:MAG: hypothetical protein KDF60_13435 [Calditrichaeota bacterium]|nr:hypothetical protein [Calditrichota bacterium]